MDLEELRRAVATAASTDELDQLASYAITLNAGGVVDDETAQALLDFIKARRKVERPIHRVRKAAARQVRVPLPARPTSWRGRSGRVKQFGHSGAVPLDRNAKVRIMTLARALMRKTDTGRAYGVITAKMYAVLGALVYGFHHGETGLCFPSYEAIAEKAGCARSTVHTALQALEACGLITWRNRLARIRERCADLFGGNGTRLRVVRTSNTYSLNDPASKSEKPMGTANPDTNLSMLLRVGAVMDDREERWQGFGFTGSPPRTARKGSPAPKSDP